MAEIKVEYDSHVGDCLKVCRMAKDSFGRITEWESPGVLSEKDQRLLHMLARGMGDKEYRDLIEGVGSTNSYGEIETLLWKFRHTTPHLAPFGHNFITFKFQAPVFVMRQIVKHEYIRISELSMRYVRGMPEYFRPKSWRAMADDVKQGSGGDLDEWIQESLDLHLNEVHELDGDCYEQDLDIGLAPEQARMLLRLCHMTQGHISGSMDAIAGLVIKRLDPHAQEETREFARQVDQKCQEIWPYSWAALTEGGHRDYTS